MSESLTLFLILSGLLLRVYLRRQHLKPTWLILSTRSSFIFNLIKACVHMCLFMSSVDLCLLFSTILGGWNRRLYLGRQHLKPTRLISFINTSFTFTLIKACVHVCLFLSSVDLCLLLCTICGGWIRRVHLGRLHLKPTRLILFTSTSFTFTPIKAEIGSCLFNPWLPPIKGYTWQCSIVVCTCSQIEYHSIFPYSPRYYLKTIKA